MVQKQIFDQFDQHQCTRIAEEMKRKKRVAILGNSYSFSVVNLLRELLSQMGYIVFEVNRNAEDQLIDQVLRETDICFVINLTGSWIDKKAYLLEKTACQKVLLTFSEQAAQSNLFEERVLFKEVVPLMSSNYYSQKVLHLWMIFMIMNMRKE
jgi:Mg/Co/Ni transporter MgtE